jgi:hypothetical protein
MADKILNGIKSADLPAPKGSSRSKRSIASPGSTGLKRKKLAVRGNFYD